MPAFSRLARLAIPALFVVFCAGCAIPHIVVHDDPLSPEEHLKLGMAYEADKEPERAAAEYRLAAGNVPLARLYLGNTLFGMGKLSAAEDAYRAALKQLPDNAEVLNNLAWLLHTRKKSLDEAESLAARAVQLEPNRQAFKDTLMAIRAQRASGR
jgi:Tfp pilus assembly protein PilF